MPPITEQTLLLGNIMAVDDDPANLKLLDDMLRQHRYQPDHPIHFPENPRRDGPVCSMEPRHPAVSGLVRYSREGIPDRKTALLIAAHQLGCQQHRGIEQEFRAPMALSCKRAPKQEPGHISYLDLERYYLGMIGEPELASLEKHLLVCPQCVARAREAREFVEAIRAALVTGGMDVD